MNEETLERVFRLSDGDRERRVGRVEWRGKQWKKPHGNAERSIEVVDVRDARCRMRAEHGDGAKIDVRDAQPVHVSRDLLLCLVVSQRRTHATHNIARDSELDLLSLQERDLFIGNTIEV